MSAITKAALIGATGNLGPAILKALLGADLEVIVLSREGSTSTDSLASHPKQTIIKADFDNIDSIASALNGVEAVVSNVASSALLSQKKLIDGAIQAGVQRFLPSDFGSDFGIAANSSVPFNQPKAEIHEYLFARVKENPSFSYTFVTNGPFFDWCLAFGLFGDLRSHHMKLWDGGDVPFSTTTLASVGKAVVGVFKNPEATRNKEIRVADTSITLRKIMGIVKEIDGQEWTTSEASTAEAYQAGLEEFKKSEPDFQFAVVSQLARIIFSAEHEPDFSHKLDNDKVGLTVMSDAQVKGVIARVLASLQK